jgi:hypothetical protein
MAFEDGEVWMWRVWAQAGERPEWLEGSLEVPFWVVALGVGAVLTGGLWYFATRVSADRRSARAERERE